jgi:hypothetical protein
MEKFLKIAAITLFSIFLFLSVSCNDSNKSLDLMFYSFHNYLADTGCFCNDYFPFTIWVERTEYTIDDQVYTVSIESDGKTYSSDEVVFRKGETRAKTLELWAESSQLCNALAEKCKTAQQAYDQLEEKAAWLVWTGQWSSMSYEEIKKIQEEEQRLATELDKYKRWISGQVGYKNTEFDEFCKKYVQLSVTQESTVPTPARTLTPTSTPMPTRTPTPTTTPVPTSVVDNIEVQGISATVDLSGQQPIALVRVTLANLSNTSQTYTVTVSCGASGESSTLNPNTLLSGQQITIEQKLNYYNLGDKFQVYLNAVFVGEVNPLPWTEQQ